MIELNTIPQAECDLHTLFKLNGDLVIMATLPGIKPRYPFERLPEVLTKYVQAINDKYK